MSAVVVLAAAAAWRVGSSTASERALDATSAQRRPPAAPATPSSTAALDVEPADKSSLPAPPDAAAIEAPRAPLVAVPHFSRDAAGRRLRSIEGFVVDDGTRALWITPLAAWVGAVELEGEPPTQLLTVDGNDLACFEAPAPVDLRATLAPWSELPIGTPLELAGGGATGAGTIASVVERDERDRLLVVTSDAPLEQRFLCDARGRLVGLARATVEGRATVVTIAGVIERQGRARPVELTAMQESLFARDPVAQRALATWYAAGGHYDASLERYLAALDLDPGLREVLVRPVTAVVELALRGARARDAVAGLLESLDRAARRFDREPRILHAFALALLDEGAAERALPYFVDAARISGASDGPLVDALRSAYLHAGEAARAQRRPADAIALLEEGLQRFREEPQLLQSLGFAYYEFGDRNRARIVLEKVASLDQRQAESLAALLASLAPVAVADDGDAVEIRFDRAGGAIRASARFGDRVEALVIVDTGASLTAISEGLADRLKVDRKRPLRRVTVTTASGRLEAPVVLLESIDLQGARVTEVEAVVLPLQDDGGGEALIGLNFLEHFDLSLDASRGLLRLAAKR